MIDYILEKVRIRSESEAALRFQQLGAAPCALVMSVIAAIGAALGDGPFGDLEMVPKMLTLQAFNASTALCERTPNCALSSTIRQACERPHPSMR